MPNTLTTAQIRNGQAKFYDSLKVLVKSQKEEAKIVLDKFILLIKKAKK